MKILVNSYYNFAQNTAGGVYSKVINYIHSAKDSDLTIKQFDVWNDKVIDYDIIHYFALKDVHGKKTWKENCNFFYSYYS